MGISLGEGDPINKSDLVEPKLTHDLKLARVCFGLVVEQLRCRGWAVLEINKGEEESRAAAGGEIELRPLRRG